MAFFCPIRLPRRKRKNREKNGGSTHDGMANTGQEAGNNAENSSIESEIERNQEEVNEEQEFEPTKMVALHDFTPCVEDELEMTRGQHVKALYRETDWLYVVADNGKEGFVPFSYCILEEEYNKNLNGHRDKPSKKLTVQQQKSKLRNTSFQESLNNSRITSTNSYEVEEFIKRNRGEFVVLFDFYAGDENDLEARKGDKVILLNDDDEDWLWVGKGNDEGFIPRLFVRPLEKHLNGDVPGIRTQNIIESSSVTPNPGRRLDSRSSDTNEHRLVIPVVTLTSPEDASENHIPSTNSDYPPDERSSGSYVAKGTNPFKGNEKRRTSSSSSDRTSSFDPGLSEKYGQEMVVRQEFIAEGPSDLTVRIGQWVYADLNRQNVYGWIWAYDPRTKTQGYVPRMCVKLPDSTPL